MIANQELENERSAEHAQLSSPSARAGQNEDINAFERLVQIKKLDSAECSVAAALHGNLRVMLRMKEYQIPISDECTSAAATNGHLNIIEFLHAHGMLDIQDCYDEANDCNQHHVMIWLNDNGLI